MANSYFTCVLDAWRDGTTLYGRMHYYRSGTYHYQDTSFPNPTMNLGGTVYEDTDFGNRVRAGIDVGDVYTTTFSRTVGGAGTRTVTFTAGSGLRSDFAGTWSVDVGGFPGTSSPPTGLSCSNVQRLQEGFSATVSLTGWGENNTGTVNRYRELQVWTASSSGLVEPRRYNTASGDSLSSTITVNNNSTHGSLTIVPNTEYTIGVYATNGAQSAGSNRVGNYTTLPPTSTLSTNHVSQTTAGFTVAVPDQGGKYDMTLSYQLDGGSLTRVTTLSGSGTKGAAFTVFDLQPGTTHTVTAALTTSAGEAVSNTITFTTEAAPAVHKFYGPAKTAIDDIQSLVIESSTRPSITGVNKTVLISKLNADSVVLSKIVQNIEITSIKYLLRQIDSSWSGRVDIVFSDGMTESRIDSGETIAEGIAFLEDWGATGVISPTGNEITTVTPSGFSYAMATKLVSKLYGSVNGQSKLITKLYGSVNGQAKLIYQEGA